MVKTEYKELRFPQIAPKPSAIRLPDKSALSYRC